MQKNFWQKQTPPFTVLAPMDGVTDVVFRQIVSEVGRPNIFFTEFTSAEALISKEGQKTVIKRLQTFKNESPVVAQIWGSHPEAFLKAAQLIKKLGFSGIDLNFGCPDHSVIKKGACSALINDPKKAAEIITATRKGAGNLPVSVKTRIGFNEDEIDNWITFLLKQNLPALTVHLRTVEEQSKVPAHWEKMKKIIKLRDQLFPQTLIIGNGDLTSMEDIGQKFKKYHCDGFMVGRGIFQNPWMFNPKINLENITPKNRLDLFLKHIHLFEKTWGTTKNPAILNKFCKTYIQNFPTATKLRENLMTIKTLEELKSTVKNYKSLDYFQN